MATFSEDEGGYAVEFRITLGTNDQKQAEALQALISDVFSREVARRFPSVEVVEETLYTY